jgi:hypothetical protein
MIAECEQCKKMSGSLGSFHIFSKLILPIELDTVASAIPSIPTAVVSSRVGF